MTLAAFCLSYALSVAYALHWGTNPILSDTPMLADPHVIQVGDRLYMYATRDEEVYHVYYSPPLSDLRLATPTSTQVNTNWTRHDTPVFVPTSSFCWATMIPGAGRGVLLWAPHVHFHPTDGKFYLYYSWCLHVGVAVADSPLGPFKNAGTLMPSYQFTIDAFVWHEPETDELYLYYGRLFEPWPLVFNGITEAIYGRRMLSPTQLADEPPVRLLAPDQHWWEFNHSGQGLLSIFSGINEGPWINKRDGIYIMTYSGASADSEYYRLGYATASHPLGPYTKHERNPIIRPSDPAEVGLYGPGHHSIWVDEERYQNSSQFVFPSSPASIFLSLSGILFGLLKQFSHVKYIHII